MKTKEDFLKQVELNRKAAMLDYDKRERIINALDAELFVELSFADVYIGTQIEISTNMDNYPKVRAIIGHYFDGYKHDEPTISSNYCGSWDAIYYSTCKVANTDIVCNVKIVIERISDEVLKQHFLKPTCEIVTEDSSYRTIVCGV